VSAPRHLHAVPDTPIPSNKPSELLREFISAHIALMVSVPDSERKSLAAKARRFGDSYSALMREMRP
jgi:hypothetical protein